jgi:hypothetical protein
MSKKVCEYLIAEGFCLLGGRTNLYGRFTSYL